MWGEVWGCVCVSDDSKIPAFPSRCHQDAGAHVTAFSRQAGGLAPQGHQKSCPWGCVTPLRRSRLLAAQKTQEFKEFLPEKGMKRQLPELFHGGRAGNSSDHLQRLQHHGRLTSGGASNGAARPVSLPRSLPQSDRTGRRRHGAPGT